MSRSLFSFDFIATHWEQGIVSFHYTLENSGKVHHFTERLTFPIGYTVNREDKEILDAALRACHLALGISYYKVHCPEDIIIKTTPLTRDEAYFWETLYTKGLGEFFYINDIDPRNRIHFPYVHSANLPQRSLSTQHKGSLVGIGGGKDSLVSVELLKKHSHSFTGFVLETGKSYPIIKETIEIAQIDSLNVVRHMDPALFNLEGYNGHIPISAIYTFVGVLTAILYGNRYVIASNEKSANYGNVKYRGFEINHQWSKSSEFENLCQTYIHHFITKDITYFSLLRPYYEVKIVENFSHFPQYFRHFSSCNRNFTVTKQALDSDTRWCLTCPKCVFAFTMLSAFLTKAEVVSIFGKDMYEDTALHRLFQELLGIKGSKPFECVGTPDEMKMAMREASKKGEYNDSFTMKYFAREVLPTIDDRDDHKSEFFQYHASTHMPQEFTQIILD